jgi:hypothetical protein
LKKKGFQQNKQKREQMKRAQWQRLKEKKKNIRDRATRATEGRQRVRATNAKP